MRRRTTDQAQRAERLRKANLVIKALTALNALKRRLNAAAGAGGVGKSTASKFPNGAAPGAVAASLQSKLALAYLLDEDALLAMLEQLEDALKKAAELEDEESLAKGWLVLYAAQVLLSQAGPCTESIYLAQQPSLY